MNMTPLEEQVADFLDSMSQLETYKICAPDLLVWNKKTGAFCFVEVKGRYDRPTYCQKETFKFFNKLGMPVVVVYPDDPDGKRYLGAVLRAMRRSKH